MQIAQTSVQQPTCQETWTLHHLTDLHVDAKDHAERELNERIREIRDDPYALWVGGGDYGDLILPGDKRTGSGWHPDAIVERLQHLPTHRHHPLLERPTNVDGIG